MLEITRDPEATLASGVDVLAANHDGSVAAFHPAFAGRARVASARDRGRGWLVRRLLVAADVTGLTASFVGIAYIFQRPLIVPGRTIEPQNLVAVTPVPT